MAESFGSPPYKSTLADHPDVRDVIPTFVFRMADYVRDLERLSAAADRENLQKLAHQLRGAGRSYGFGPITDLAVDIETALKTGKPFEDIAPTVKRLVGYMRNVEGYRD